MTLKNYFYRVPWKDKLWLHNMNFPTLFRLPYIRWRYFWKFHLQMQLLVPSCRGISTFLEIVPTSYPRPPRSCSSLRRSMAVEVVHNLVLHSYKYLWWKLSHMTKEVMVLIDRERYTEKLVSKSCLTGFMVTTSGGCSWPVSHFHRSGFSCRYEQG